MPAMPASGRLKNGEFQASLGYIVRSCLKKSPANIFLNKIYSYLLQVYKNKACLKFYTRVDVALGKTH
jgi:hypothetical protein